MTLLLACACRPCTWPNRVEPEPPSLNIRALQEGLEAQIPARAEPYAWESIFLEDPRRWARAAGLYDLSTVLLPEGVVEVRIWEFYRNRYQGAIVQKRNGSFLGAELSFGSIEPDNCAGWAVGLEPCVSWESAWLELLDLGLMDLPDSTELPGERWVEDGVAYVVELQSQGKYRTYLYANPDYQTWPEARRIEKIIDVVGRRIRCDQYRPG